MFNAIEPIYNKFFEVLQQRFAADTYTREQEKLPVSDRRPNPFEDETENLFKFLDIGIRSFNNQVITMNDVPYGALEWGETNRVKGFRMPESYTYELRIPLVLVTMASSIDHRNPRIQTIFPNGVGEFTRKIGGFFWQQYHTGRFGEAVPSEFAGDAWDWSIVDFSEDIQNPMPVVYGVDAPMLREFQELLQKKSTVSRNTNELLFQDRGAETALRGGNHESYRSRELWHECRRDCRQADEI